MNNRGLTLIEILAVIVILGIVMSVAVVSYNSIISNTEIKTYKNYENSMKSSAMMYIIDNGVPTDGKITLRQLLNDKRIEYFNNPKSDDQCLESYVIVEKINSTNLKYNICLVCPEYKTDNPNCE